MTRLTNFDDLTDGTILQHLEQLKPERLQRLLSVMRQDGDLSDGYHTFNELYEHRMALTATLCRALPYWAWRSKSHHPAGDPMFEGFFVVGLDLPTGTITYHYKLEHWDIFKPVPEVEYAPLWDGHTPADVVKRLLEWVKS